MAENGTSVPSRAVFPVVLTPETSNIKREMNIEVKASQKLMLIPA